jgi:hypothetical protein
MHVPRACLPQLQTNEEYALLPAVPYGEKGPFAINFWAKFGDLSGPGLAYLYSHNSTAAAPPGINATNISVLLPNEASRHPWSPDLRGNAGFPLWGWQSAAIALLGFPLEVS